MWADIFICCSAHRIGTRVIVCNANLGGHFNLWSNHNCNKCQRPLVSAANEAKQSAHACMLTRGVGLSLQARSHLPGGGNRYLVLRPTTRVRSAALQCPRAKRARRVRSVNEGGRTDVASYRNWVAVIRRGPNLILRFGIRTGPRFAPRMRHEGPCNRRLHLRSDARVEVSVEVRGSRVRSAALQCPRAPKSPQSPQRCSARTCFWLFFAFFRAPVLALRRCALAV